MERIYINRDCCVAYTVLALHTIKKTANNGIELNDFIKEIKTMFEVYQDEIELMRKTHEILKEEGHKKIYFIDEEDKKIGITIEECAKYMGISKQLMAEIVREPGFPCLKFKRRFLINKSKVQEWFDENCGKRIKY